MVLLSTPELEGNKNASDFQLKGTDNQIYTLSQFTKKPDFKGLVVSFICNHCPYVKEISSQLQEDAAALQKVGIYFVAIMPNDYNTYPDDSFPNMQKFSQDNGFTFPYLLDETQEVAKEYGAVCTPDFFGFNKDLVLCYRGRLRDKKNQSEEGRELYHAMQEIAQNKTISKKQYPSMGCSIKWKNS